MSNYKGNTLKEMLDVLHLVQYDKNTNVTSKRFASSSIPITGDSTKTGQTQERKETLR